MYMYRYMYLYIYIHTYALFPDTFIISGATCVSLTIITQVYSNTEGRREHGEVRITCTVYVNKMSPYVTVITCSSNDSAVSNYCLITVVLN